MALQYYMYLTIGLILLILSTGCTDSSSESPPLPTLSTLPVPDGNPITPSLQSIGDVTGHGIPGGAIDTISLTVGLSDIHESVDMEQLAIVYADLKGSETLRPVDGFHGDPPKGYWSIVLVDNEVGSPNNRLDNKELFTLMLNPTAYLVQGQLITIVIKPPSGHSLTIRRVAPPTIQADNLLLSL